MVPMSSIKAINIVESINRQNAYYAVLEVQDGMPMCHVVSCEQSARLLKHSIKTERGHDARIVWAHNIFCPIRKSFRPQQFVFFCMNSDDTGVLADAMTARLFLAGDAMETPGFVENLELPTDVADEYEKIWQQLDDVIDGDKEEVVWESRGESYAIFRTCYDTPHLDDGSSVMIPKSRLKYDETWLV